MRERLTYANVMATIAVFIALGGGAYAAVTLKKGQVKGKHIAKSAVTSKKVKNRSLKAVDFRAGQLPPGAKGDTGAPGERGATGPTGPRGADYDPEAVLAPGQTLRGEFAASGKDPNPGGYFEFRIPLPADLGAEQSHYLDPSETTEDCPGPGEAAPGHLCVYARFATHQDSTWAVFHPDMGANGASRYGFGLVRPVSGVASGTQGTWAVTAPE